MGAGSVRRHHSLEPGDVRDDKEGGALEEDDLVRGADRAEVGELRFQQLHVGDEGVHDLRPRAVQRFVPDGRRETLHFEPATVGQGQNVERWRE